MTPDPPGGPPPEDYVFRGETPGGEGDEIRHFWSSELFLAPSEPGQEPRHVGTIEPLWSLLDLTPQGRGSGWDEQLSPCCHAAAR